LDLLHTAVPGWKLSYVGENWKDRLRRLLQRGHASVFALGRKSETDRNRQHKQHEETGDDARHPLHALDVTHCPSPRQQKLSRNRQFEYSHVEQDGHPTLYCREIKSHDTYRLMRTWNILS